MVTTIWVLHFYYMTVKVVKIISNGIVVDSSIWLTPDTKIVREIAYAISRFRTNQYINIQ